MFRMRRASATLSVLILWLPLSGDAALAQLPIPAGLDPGDKYQLVFNSSISTWATSTSIDVYNGVAQAAADAAGIGATVDVGWSAIASTSTVDAKTNAVVGTNAPVYNMKLDLLATGFSDMWDGSLSAQLAWDEFGQSNPVDAWTGTDIDGTAAAGLELGHSGGSAWCGRPTLTNALWINFFTPPTTTLLPVYALSEELTVPLPGDYNPDGTVDAADYTVWRNALGQTGSGLAADGDLSGVVDRGDFIVWKTNFGATASSGSPSNTSLPEPSAVWLLIHATAGVGLRCRHPALRVSKLISE